MKKERILHISTAHQPTDPRVVYKQCRTLAQTYDVYCAIPNARPDIVPEIHFIRLPYFKRVIWRTLITCPFIVLRCIWLQPHIIHVYVPEFIPFAFLFKWMGVSVIYEVQENLYKKMHLKTYNRGWLLERAFRYFDQLARQHFTLIFTEHGYLDTYTHLTKPYAVIYNYPLLPDLLPYRQPYRKPSEPITFFYIGWLTFERAFDAMLEAFVLLKQRYPSFTVHLFGRRTFTQDDLECIPAYHAVKENLIFYGYTDQPEALPYAAKAVAGIALLKPVGDYPDSYTTKMFEYMALGLPVLTSNFPLYQNVVERHQCGFCVDPTDITAVADRLIWMIEHRDEAGAMGQRGYEAVVREYNWDTEARKLLDLYASLG